MNCSLVVCRNNLEQTKGCLKSLLDQSAEEYLVIVIDNQSTDGTMKWLNGLQKQFANLFLVYNFNRESVAACWNMGLRYAWGLGAEECLVVNNDTELLSQTYPVLKELLYSTQNVGICSAISVRDRSGLSGFSDDLQISDHPDFSCFMISRECFKLVGGFDENFLIAYGEDCDYHSRMHRLGIRAINCTYPFLHHASGTIKSASKEERLEIQKQSMKNREYFYSKWGKRIGTEGYSDLFKPELFGAWRHWTGKTG